MSVSLRTQVAVVGAGPAGLILGRMLDLAGVDNAILEARDRAYCEGRQRAGVLEHGTVELLREIGVAERLDREGLVHGGIELRFAGVGHRVAMDELTGGKTVTVYGQTEVVKDLIALRLQRGGPLRFDTPATAIEGFTGSGSSTVHATNPEGEALRVTADVVVAADGFHGVGRLAVAHAVTVMQHSYPYAWLGILADVAPSCRELIYCHHDRGFSLHSMRSERVSRLYLQVDPDEDLGEWPDDRVWEELATRLASDGWSLREGPVVEKSITPMRSFVARPLRHGNLYLAGDAAHIVPPTGAKGLNLAARDVQLLGRALVAWYRDHDRRLLDEYSDTCLRRVWRAQDFSYWMTTMLHRDPGDTDGYVAGLQRARLAYVTSSEAAARTLAENYVGFDEI